MRRVFFFLGFLLFAATAAEIPFERTEVTSPLKIGSRRRVLPYTHIFARIQPYNLYGNYLEWIDRPLYHDTRWRHGGAAQAFRRDAEIATLEYGIDGFTMLGNSYATRYADALRLLETSGIANFRFMPGMGWKPVSAFNERDVNNAKWAYGSRFTFRIDGKVPFFNYRSTTPQNLAAYRAELEKRGFRENLLFNSFMFNVYSEYFRSGEVAPATMEREAARLESVLETADGLVLTNHQMFRDERKDYYLSRRFCFDLDEKYLAPAVERIYAKPENARKLLGFDVRHGYIGHRSGIVEAQQGTAQFREAMDTALLFNPDIISLVEWNEANENTSLQPTVSSGRTIQRLLRFYTRKLKGLPSAPNPGDDMSLPDLIVSVRRSVNYGEYYRIELLNVPDADTDETYRVALTLKDERGRVIRAFAPDTFVRGKLTAVTYRIPSELLAPIRAVVPELAVEWQGSRRCVSGLRATLLEVSLSSDCLEARTPIRDILPCWAECAIPDGRVVGKVYAPVGKKLTSVEVVDRDVPVVAVDATPEFDPRREDNILVKFHARKQQLAPMTLTVGGTDRIGFRPWGRPYAGFGSLKAAGNRLEGELLIFHGGSAFMLRVPKTANGDIQLTLGEEKTSLSLAELRKVRKFAVELGTLGGVRFELRTAPDDHPEPLDSACVEFDAEVRPELPNPAYSLLVLGDGGKVWRSVPCFPVPESSEMTEVKVFSAHRSEPVTIRVPASRILEADYQFTPVHGTIFAAKGIPAFDGELGNGFFYTYPMWGAKLPPGAGATTPQWVAQPDGTYLLRFDGKANYLVFPIDAIPATASTACFEIRPADGGDMALLRSTHVHPAGMQSWIENGTLRVAFARFRPSYGAQTDEYDTGLAIVPGKWQRVTLSFDYECLRAEVDGRVWLLPCRHRPAFYCASIFGGFSSGDRWFNQTLAPRGIGFFHGDLRFLRFRHNAAPPSADELETMKRIAVDQMLAEKINGKFRRATAALPRNWYFNRGYKPQGSSELIPGKEYSQVKLTAAPQAPAQIYSVPLPGKAGEVYECGVVVSGGSGSIGVGYYDAETRYCRGGDEVKFPAGEGRRTVRLPLRDIPGQNPTACFRLNLTAAPGQTVVFSRLTLRRVVP